MMRGFETNLAYPAFIGADNGHYGQIQNRKYEKIR